MDHSAIKMTQPALATDGGSIVWYYPHACPEENIKVDYMPSQYLYRESEGIFITCLLAVPNIQTVIDNRDSWDDYPTGSILRLTLNEHGNYIQGVETNIEGSSNLYQIVGESSGLNQWVLGGDARIFLQAAQINYTQHAVVGILSPTGRVYQHSVSELASLTII